MSELELVNAKDVKEYVQKYGVSKIDEFLKSKLEGWREVEINIAVTGDSGAGKSSFINAIREIDDIHPKAAAVNVVECTTEPACYDHPTNPKLKFWDLPGIGTPKLPDLNAYCKNVPLEKYHTYLIFVKDRFPDDAKELAQKIRSIGKKFFFIRARIDQDIANDRHSKKHRFDEDSTLDTIRKDCYQNLIETGLLSNKEEIFLISNHYPAEWEFGKLTKAILDVLPIRQQESLTLTIDIATSLSTEILQRKVEVLKRRLCVVAAASAAAACVPIPVVSIAADLALIRREINFYKSQLGLPEEGSNKFSLLSPNTQNRILALSTTFSSAMQIGGLIATFASEQALEEVARFMPFIGLAVGSAMSAGATYFFLKCWLENMENLALVVLKEGLEDLKND